jgi:hypothetical protein
MLPEMNETMRQAWQYAGVCEEEYVACNSKLRIVARRLTIEASIGASRLL